MSIELVVQDVSGTLRVSSRDIAEARGKEHRNVLQIIDDLIELDPTLGQLNFQPSNYLNEQNKSQRQYLCDEEGALLIGVNLGPRKDAIAFQRKLVGAFLEARSRLQALRVPLPPQDPLALLEMSVAEIKKERSLRLVVEAERDHLAKTKHLISTSREASALGKLGALGKKVNVLDLKVKNLESEKSVVEEALKDYKDEPIKGSQKKELHVHANRYVERMIRQDETANVAKLYKTFWGKINSDAGVSKIDDILTRNWPTAVASAKLMADGALVCVRIEGEI